MWMESSRSCLSCCLSACLSVPGSVEGEGMCIEGQGRRSIRGLGSECLGMSGSSESGCVFAEEKAGCRLLLYAQSGC